MSSSSNLSDLLAVLGYGDSADVPDDLLPFIGFLISKAAQSIVENVDEGLSNFGITSRHYGVLLVLSRQDALRQIDIGNTLQIDRTTMVKLVDELEKVGYIERHRDPNDRRAYALSLSDKGRKILPDISSRAIQLEKTSLATLNQEEMQNLFRILLKLLKQN